MIRYEPSQTKVKMIYGTNPAGANDVLLYAMFAGPNAKSSDAAWQIKYFTYDADDNLLNYEYPRNDEGNASADFKWIADNYADYDYGPA